MTFKQLPDASTFKTVIAEGVSLVDFNAPWCGPCRAQAPILEQVAAAYAGKAVIAEMNVDDNQDTAARYFVQSVPTLIVFKDGKEMKRFIGFQAEHVIKAALDDVLS